MSRALYSQGFFSAEATPSSGSAERVVPVLAELYAPASVVDVGCGLGHWLAAFRSRGVTDVLGLDGTYVPVDRLAIPPSDFMAVDLHRPPALQRRFDMALCLEVGEHLPAESAASLVGFLVAASDIVVFSAAVPGQGGQHHVNEQWQSYWVRLFRQHGYRPLDDVRRALWLDPGVQPYYLQNCLTYVPAAAASGRQVDLIDVVHPRLFLESSHAAHMSPRALVRALPSSLSRTVRRRLAARRAR
jgi:SAM-dependent methyltransferase